MRSSGRLHGLPPERVDLGIECGQIEPFVVDDGVGRGAQLEDVGNVAAFVASDKARTMTAATANISCGALID